MFSKRKLISHIIQCDISPILYERGKAAATIVTVTISCVSRNRPKPTVPTISIAFEIDIKNSIKNEILITLAQPKLKSSIASAAPSIS